MGKLRLDDAIETYLSGLHNDIGVLTISQFLCHGAGVIRDGADCGYFYDRMPYPTVGDLTADFQSPPIIKPDEYFKYSNHGYGLLGLVIEAVTGEAYASWVGREVIDAARLKETSPEMPTAASEPFARGHTDDMLLGKRLVVPGDYSTAALTPSIGLVTTVRDLASFFAQLSPEAETSPLLFSSRQEMTRKRLSNRHASIELHYGYGVLLGTVEDWTWFGHSGALQGYLSRTKMLPSQDLTISLMANSADAPVEQWTNGAIQILRAFKMRGAPPTELRDWVGRWWGPWGVADLVPVGNAVIVANPQAANPFLDASELQVSDPDTARIAPSTSFLYHGEAARRVRDGAGQPVELWLAGDRFLLESDRAAEIIRKYSDTRSDARMFRMIDSPLEWKG